MGSRKGDWPGRSQPIRRQQSRNRIYRVVFGSLFLLILARCDFTAVSLPDAILFLDFRVLK
jgi:uncharacterized membrane protein YraQ (UPF0718 family)